MAGTLVRATRVLPGLVIRLADFWPLPSWWIYWRFHVLAAGQKRFPNTPANPPPGTPANPLGNVDGCELTRCNPTVYFCWLDPKFGRQLLRRKPNANRTIRLHSVLPVPCY